jgi:hypothetical protein
MMCLQGCLDWIDRVLGRVINHPDIVQRFRRQKDHIIKARQFPFEISVLATS